MFTWGGDALTERLSLDLPDLQQGYVDLVRIVAATGDHASPRGLRTREVIPADLHFDDVRNLLPVGVGRGVSTVFNAAGAACLVGGVTQLLLRIAPRFADFDADGIDREGYGPRSWRQVLGCVAHLAKDPDTREAIVVIQPPRTSDADGGRVFPCTTSLQFLIRDGALHMQSSMRSNDVWSGLSGDVWAFSQLQRTMAWALGVQVGSLHHHATSLHIYEADSGLPGMSKLDALHAPDRAGVDVPGFTPPGPFHGSSPIARMLMAQGWARTALGCGFGPWPLPPAVKWFRKKLEKHLRHCRLCDTCRTIVEDGTECECK
jgi:hypothetical protein